MSSLVSKGWDLGEPRIHWFKWASTPRKWHRNHVSCRKSPGKYVRWVCELDSRSEASVDPLRKYRGGRRRSFRQRCVTRLEKTECSGRLTNTRALRHTHSHACAYAGSLGQLFPFSFSDITSLFFDSVTNRPKWIHNNIYFVIMVALLCHRTRTHSDEMQKLYYHFMQTLIEKGDFQRQDTSVWAYTPPHP